MLKLGKAASLETLSAILSLWLVEDEMDRREADGEELFDEQGEEVICGGMGDEWARVYRLEKVVDVGGMPEAMEPVWVWMVRVQVRLILVIVMKKICSFRVICC